MEPALVADAVAQGAEPLVGGVVDAGLGRRRHDAASLPFCQYVLPSGRRSSIVGAVGSAAVNAERQNALPLPWPLFTIDFEASGLQPGNFPIEVGICRWMTPDCPIEGWSVLIQPTAAWEAEGTWAAEAEAIHGISREDLRGGSPPEDVVTALNAIIRTGAAFCDGGFSDLAWARRLILASGVTNTFRMGDFDALAGRCDTVGYARLVRWLDHTPARHRARDDAERLMRALGRGLGLELGPSGDIASP